MRTPVLLFLFLCFFFFLLVTVAGSFNSNYYFVLGQPEEEEKLQKPNNNNEKREASQSETRAELAAEAEIAKDWTEDHIKTFNHTYGDIHTFIEQSTGIDDIFRTFPGFLPNFPENDKRCRPNGAFRRDFGCVQARWLHRSEWCCWRHSKNPDKVRGLLPRECCLGSDNEKREEMWENVQCEEIIEELCKRIGDPIPEKPDEDL